MDYKTWLNHESKWMAGYRKKTMRQMKFVTTPIVALGLGVIMVIRNFGRDPEIMVEYFFGGFIGGLVLMGFVLLFMSMGLSRKRVTRGIEDEVRELGLSPEQRDAMAQELSAVEGKEASHISFTMNGPGLNGTPADVIVSRSYAMMLGGSPLVRIVRLSDVDHVEPGEEQKSATEYGGKTKTTTSFTLYTVNFIGKTKPLRGFGFLDKALRDKALGMIERQLH